MARILDSSYAYQRSGGSFAIWTNYVVYRILTTSEMRHAPNRERMVEVEYNELYLLCSRLVKTTEMHLPTA